MSPQLFQWCLIFMLCVYVVEAQLYCGFYENKVKLDLNSKTGLDACHEACTKNAQTCVSWTFDNRTMECGFWTFDNGSKGEDINHLIYDYSLFNDEESLEEELENECTSIDDNLPNFSLIDLDELPDAPDTFDHCEIAIFPNLTNLSNSFSKIMNNCSFVQVDMGHLKTKKECISACKRLESKIYEGCIGWMWSSEEVQCHGLLLRKAGNNVQVCGLP